MSVDLCGSIVCNKISAKSTIDGAIHGPIIVAIDMYAIMEAASMVKNIPRMMVRKLIRMTAN